MTIYRKSECEGGKWTEFIAAMNSGNEFEIDEEMFDYWLNVLPPVFMNRTINWVPCHEGQPMKVDFGFAEGAEPITVFWRSPDGRRIFGQQTHKINRG